MDQLVEELQKFQFTRMEASAYITLIRNSPANGSQLAKMLNAPRTSVYSAIESLFKKGAVYSLPGEPTRYVALTPKKFLKRLKTDYDESMDFLNNNLKEYKSYSSAEQYWNLAGESGFQEKTTELISLARKEIVLHTNQELTPFLDVLREAAERGVRIIMFSFVRLDLQGIPCEWYYNRKFDIEDSLDKRTMMVVDMKRAILAGGQLNGEFLGTFTENDLFVSILAEHIHHDIYLHKLEEKTGTTLIDHDIQINSLLETGFEEWLDHHDHI